MNFCHLDFQFVSDFDVRILSLKYCNLDSKAKHSSYDLNEMSILMPLTYFQAFLENRSKTGNISSLPANMPKIYVTFTTGWMFIISSAEI